MGAAFPPIGAVIVLAACALGPTACGSASPHALVGVSNAPAEAREPAKASLSKAVVTWPDYSLAQAWPEAAPPVAALGHRRDGTRIHVRVEPSSLGAYRALATDAPMPDGSRVVAFHESPAGQPLGGYVLEKRAGVWTALELDAKGTRLRNDGSACLRCHDLAPTDHLFGLTARAGQVAAPAPPGN